MTAFHPDHCGHGEDCYAGSFVMPDGGKFDCYSFLQATDKGRSWCVRFGPEGDEYISDIRVAADYDAIDDPEFAFFRISISMLQAFDEAQCATTPP